ncbi:MAG: hypothetical protein MOB07_23190 [Acidobacteria bacterium]|nr:hypothetical protein [Acidobacteriota bacterium]
MADVFLPDIDPGDVSGGTAGGGGGTVGGQSGDANDPGVTIDEFITDEGGVLAVPYGKHLIGGHLIVHKYAVGPPPSSIFAVALAEGEFDAAEKVWYAGEELSVSPDGSTAGYHFHPGNISTGISDPTQPVDSFLSSGLAYSGTANVVVKLPDKFAIEDRPDKLRGRFRCKKTYDYDCSGAQQAFAYWVNPATIAVDRVRRSFEQRYFDNLALAYAKFRDRINWPAWCRWWDYNAALITWNDGTTSNRQIPRFECHIAFTEDLALADALDQICASAGAFWQDDGEQIVFQSAEDRAPIHTFHAGYFDPSGSYVKGNIVEGSFQVSPRDIRERPNYMVAKFRNLDDEFLTPTSVYVKRDELIRKVGKIESVRSFPNMYISQAQRLLQRQMRIETDNPIVATLRGQGDSLHVLPGDFALVSHPIANWTFQKCLVVEAGIDSGEKTADECDFTLQAVSGPLYFDTDHQPVQVAIAP